MTPPFRRPESRIVVTGARGSDPFAESEDQSALRSLAREVGRRAVAPHARQGDSTGELQAEAVGALAAADLFRITIGERWGGLGLGDVEAAVVLEEIARHGVEITGRHQGMGIHAATEAEVAFDGVAVGGDDVLIAGDAANSDAFKVLLGHLNHERCGNAAMCIGAAQGALEHAVRYMNEREVGGRPIAELQGLRWKLADMAAQLEGARLLLTRAVHLAGPGEQK